MSNLQGVKAEGFFREMLERAALEFSYDDSWYDFSVAGRDGIRHKVEVKSCQVSILDKKTRLPRIGRWDFTKSENREKQQAENVWLAFVLHHFDSHLLLGFLRASEIGNRRYVKLHHLRALEPLDFESWVRRILR